MAVLAGVVQTHTGGPLPALFDRMRIHLSVPDASLRTVTDSSQQAFAGFDARWSAAASNGAGVSAILSGSLVGDDGRHQYSGEEGAARLVRAYEARGDSFATSLQGAFRAVLIDEREYRVLLVNDVLGTFPLYWHHDGDRFAFGSTLRSVVPAMRGQAALDLRAAADYLHFGLVFGSKTLAAGIELVPAGVTLIFDWARGSLTRVRNQRPSDLFAPVEQTHDEYNERVLAAFNESVARACQDAPALGLSLSGGLDSRAILSAIPPRNEPVRSYTVGVRLCADDVIATKLSSLAGTSHYFMELGDQYLRDFLPNLSRMVDLTDGMYLSHGLTEVLALRAVQDSGMQTLLRGHCGELAKARLAWPFHTDDRVFAMRSSSEFVPYYFARVNYVSKDVPAGELFSSDLRATVEGAARQSLQETVDAGSDLQPADLCSFVYLTEHHRRFTIPSIELFRSSVDVRMPFADERFLRVLLGGRPEWRDRTDLHRYVTGTNAPRLLAVRNSNTGAPGSAGPLLERLLDPVNSILKKLNAPGYRHYHQFDAWMRTQLFTSVEEVLFDGATSRRGVFDARRLRQVVDATRTGKADYSYLLQVLLVIELWQRQIQPVARAA